MITHCLYPKNHDCYRYYLIEIMMNFVFQNCCSSAICHILHQLMLNYYRDFADPLEADYWNIHLQNLFKKKITSTEIMLHSYLDYEAEYLIIMCQNMHAVLKYFLNKFELNLPPIIFFLVI